MSGGHRVVSEYAMADNANSNIRVYIRARPCEDESEPGDFLQVSGDESRKINIRDPDESNRKYGEVAFEFDKVFWTATKQEEVFSAMCKPQVDHVLNGFNCCCFAYGQTGSGKTYSMFGYDSEVRGIIPRAAEYLFSALEKKSTTCEVGVVCSFLEIYNDAIRDLGKAYLISIGAEANTSSAIFHKTSHIFESLAGKRGNPYFAPAFYNSSPTKGGSSSEVAVRGLGYKEVLDEYHSMNYEIREDSDGNVFVGNLSMVPVTTIDEVMAMIETGLKLRATHETKMNATSSRSHTVFTMSVLQRDKLTDVTIQGMLNLVDLAGSERLKKSESVGIRLKEALHINTSLSALGKVIMSLDPNSENTHIPYRDSKLTRLLQNSLGGNSYTIVLAAIHPHASHYEECLSTLQFANRCRNVKNNPRVNYVDDPTDKDMKIKRLTEEIALLRTKLAAAEKGGGGGEGRNKISPNKLVELLKKLGIKADLAPDGALIVNGQRHELGDLGLGGDDDDDDDDEDGEGGAGGFGAGGEEGGFGVFGVMGFGKMSKKKMKKMLMELTEANRNHSVKSKERKVLMQEQGRQIEELSRQVSRLTLAAKHHDVALAQLKEAEGLRREEDLKASEDMHRKELDKLMAQHDAAHKRTMELFDKAPATFKNYSTLLKQQQEAKQSFEEPLREEFRVQLKLMQDAAHNELTNVKKQYEYWLKEKETMLEGFVDQFNAYRTKTKEQLKMCETEIIKMYEYMVKTDDILDGVERGVYKVERHQGKHGRTTTGHAAMAATLNATAVRATSAPPVRSGVPDAAGLLATVDPVDDDDDHAIAGGKGRVLFPKGLRPTNPLKGSGGGADGMKLAKKIVEKYAQRKEKLEETRKWVAKKTTALAANLMMASAGPGAGGNNNEEGEVDPYVEQHLRELLGRVGGAQPRTGGTAAAAAAGASPSKPKRPSTAGAARTRPDYDVENEQRAAAALRRTESATAVGATSPGRAGAMGASTRSLSSTGSPVVLGGIRRRSLGSARRSSVSPTNDSVGDADAVPTATAEEVRQMRLEMSELRQQIKVDQQLIAGISSNQLMQYISQLEAQNSELHKQVQQQQSGLHAAKIANATLTTQREDKRLAATVGGNVR